MYFDIPMRFSRKRLNISCDSSKDFFYTGMTLQVRLKFDPKMAYPVQRSLDLFGLLRTMAFYVTETFALIPWLRTILTIAWTLGS